MSTREAERAVPFVIIATLTLAIDFSFHFIETTPLELWTYFLSIFVFALAGAVSIPQLGIIGGALVFTSLKTAYNIFAVLFNVQGLTVLTQTCTITFNGFPSTYANCLGASNLLSQTNLIYGTVWFALHAGMFIVAAYLSFAFVGEPEG
jgi:hypothetical protein